MRLLFSTITFTLLSFALLGCSKDNQQSRVQSDNQVERQANKQHVLLISIDGYRHDYTELHQPKMLQKIAQGSAKVRQLKPSYPSKTFPNHITLVTGLYPQNHGIVSNRFYREDLDQTYTLSDAGAVTNSQFYQGVPLWSLAAQQGLNSATYFWPSSEAEIAGHRPTYWKTYDHHQPLDQRIEQVVKWFSLDEKQRPRFTALYFHEVDSAGHTYGPKSAQTKAAIDKVDAALAQLVTQLDALPIDINIIITADHGMTRVTDMPRIYIDQLFANNKALASRFKFEGSGPFVQMYAIGEDKQSDIQEFMTLTQGIEGLEAYPLADIPPQLNFNNNAAIGDVLLKSESHYLSFTDAKPASIATHGFDPDVGNDMHTLLYGYGPAFNPQAEVPIARNIHVYPLIAHILGLQINEPIDGKLEVLTPLLVPALAR